MDGEVARRKSLHPRAIEVHVRQRNPFHRRQASCSRRLQDTLGRDAMRNGRPPVLRPEGPFKDDNPRARYPPCLRKCPDRVIGLMEHVSKKDEVEGARLEGKVFRHRHLERTVGNEAPRDGKEIRVRIDPGHAKRPLAEGLRKDPCPGADVQNALQIQTLPAELDNPGGFQKRQSLGGAQALGSPMESTFISVHTQRTI